MFATVRVPGSKGADVKKLAALVVLLIVMVLLAFASVALAASTSPIGEGPDGWNDGRCPCILL